MTPQIEITGNKAEAGATQVNNVTLSTSALSVFYDPDRNMTHDDL